MAIYRPGYRPKSRILKRKKTSRNVVAVLSLTAMVDMFTVLTIFLLQNYNSTGKVIDIPKEVVLPQARAYKDLDPAYIVNLSADGGLLLGRTPLMSYSQIKAQPEWMLESLFKLFKNQLETDQIKRRSQLELKLREAVDEIDQEQIAREERDAKRVTVQADKNIDFLTVKKVMYTLTEAGASEINFAVLKKEIDN